MIKYEEDGIRNKILNLISKNPGLYPSKIAEILDLKLSYIEYYLLRMEREDLIKSIKKDGFDRYFISEDDKGIQEGRTSEIRDLIYDLILKNPGLHLSKIAELLNMRISHVEYHLKYLEKKGNVVSIRRNSYYKRYYIKHSGFDEKDKKLIEVLRKELPLKIIIYLLKNSNAKYGDIQEYLDISAPLLSYHLNKLVKKDIIDPPSINNKGYSLSNKKDILRFLRQYKIHLFKEGFKDIWSDFSYYDRKEELG
ncbi:MAG: winged helix-turn-helix transcriptional regulator [Candidatus Lokiarchaeota archaeon]|nr:winged helix-turn-helix transcriptional regulator [Candidatus Lokiarchaeota archaeon]